MNSISNPCAEVRAWKKSAVILGSSNPCLAKASIIPAKMSGSISLRLKIAVKVAGGIAAKYSCIFSAPCFFSWLKSLYSSAWFLGTGKRCLAISSLSFFTFSSSWMFLRCGFGASFIIGSVLNSSEYSGLETSSISGFSFLTWVDSCSFCFL